MTREIRGIQAFRKERKDASTVKFLSLSEYTKLAKELINKILLKNRRSLAIGILKNEDDFAEVVQALITADWTHDEEKSLLSTWRVEYVKWAIMSIASNISKSYSQKDISIFGEENEELPGMYSDRWRGRSCAKVVKHPKETDIDLDHLIGSSHLSPREFEIINLSRQMSQTDIAEKLQVSRQFVSAVLQTAILKIRAKHDIKTT
jgi:DNA-binding CsgD family transcriptional regulator